MVRLMRVIEIRGAGGPEVLHLAERPLPVPQPGEVVIEVTAIGINRPDIQQRRGLYPPPPDASDLPGLDVAGIICAVGEGVDTAHLGREVCALTHGGGYAQYCAVPLVQCMTIPQGLSHIEAASLPEAFFTAWNNVVMLGRLAAGEKLFLQGGSSGVGLAAMQIARSLFAAEVYATAGSAEKQQLCRAYGADFTCSYKDADWEAQIRAASGGAGVDIVLDGQAGPYVQKQLDLLRSDGRLVLIASHLGKVGEVNFNDIVRRRLTLTGSTLRPRPPAYKGQIARAMEAQVWPLIASGQIRPFVDRTFRFEEMREAHRVMDANAQLGKIVVTL